MSAVQSKLQQSASGGMTTAVIGLGISGMSCLRHLYSHDDLVVIDDRTEPANLAQAREAFPRARFFVGAEANSPKRWENVERLVLSPGVAANDPLLAGSENLKQISDIDLFLAEARAPVVGITGTNGKSTVTALVGHILRELGFEVRVGGNLGEPALDLLSDSAEVYVLELSSFQIEHSADLPLAAATVLNLSVDHLDRHGDLANYAAIKRRIYACAQACIFNSGDALTQPTDARTADSFGADADARWRLERTAQGCSLVCDDQVFAKESDFSLTGQHNMLNVLAAFALVSALELDALPAFDQSAQRYVQAAGSFGGLEHRAEFVRELRGVNYVNDSKATNVGASVAALAGYPQRADQPGTVVLLAGGQGKGADFDPLGAAAAGRVKRALVFGEDASQIEAALSRHTTVERCATFEIAVETAERVASAGDTVLLAPACASFDMFASFTARGERFKELVGALR